MTLGQNVPKLDALHLMDGIEGLRSLPKHSVDMLLTDPPYGTTRNFWDVPLPLPELWEAVRWAVKPNGAILFFAQCPFDKVLGASNLAMLRYEWVWYKSRATGFLNANRAPLKKSENTENCFDRRLFMAISKSAKIQAEIEKVTAKINEQQARLKELEQKKLEAENSEIVEIVRGMSVSLTDLPVLLQTIKSGGALGQNVPKAADKEDSE